MVPIFTGSVRKILPPFLIEHTGPMLWLQMSEKCFFLTLVIALAVLNSFFLMDDSSNKTRFRAFHHRGHVPSCPHPPLTHPRSLLEVTRTLLYASNCMVGLHETGKEIKSKIQMQALIVVYLTYIHVIKCFKLWSMEFKSQTVFP